MSWFSVHGGRALAGIKFGDKASMRFARTSFRSQYRIVQLAMLLVLSSSAAVFAQQEAVKPEFDRLRTTPLTSTIDRQRVEKWLDQEIPALYQAESPLSAGAAFFKSLNQHLRANDATSGFKTGMTGLLNGALLKAYEPMTAEVRESNALVTVFLLSLMKASTSANGLPAYQAAISDPTPGVRLVAADAIERVQLSTEQWTQLVPAIRQAASTESSPAVVQRYYRILQRQDGPPEAVAAEAMVAILQARTARFEQDSEFPCVGDARAIGWLTQRASRAANSDLRPQVIQVAAKLVADAVHSYVSESVTGDLQHQLERVIILAEGHLKALARGGEGDQPNVSQILTSDVDSRLARLQDAVNAWIGTADADGYLNKAPFNLPRGLGITRPADDEEANGES
jgi:hypothetical protein